MRRPTRTWSTCAAMLAALLEVWAVGMVLLMVCG